MVGRFSEEHSAERASGVTLRRLAAGVRGGAGALGSGCGSRTRSTQRCRRLAVQWCGKLVQEDTALWSDGLHGGRLDITAEDAASVRVMRSDRIAITALGLCLCDKYLQCETSRSSQAQASVRTVPMSVVDGARGGVHGFVVQAGDPSGGQRHRRSVRRTGRWLGHRSVSARSCISLELLRGLGAQLRVRRARGELRWRRGAGGRARAVAE